MYKSPQKILLGVCGSISAYRSYDVLRHWYKKGLEVKVVLTKGAEKFVQPELFRYLGASAVYTDADYFTPPREGCNNPYVLHIDLARWADLMVICPASANTLAHMAQGYAESLLDSVFLAAADKPVVLYPSMNTNMLSHHITQKNMDILRQLPNVFIHPAAAGTLACGETGDGKLPEVARIGEFSTIINPLNLDYASHHVRKVVITTGATISPLDPVRYLTNPSSGLTGYYLAIKYLEEGHLVTVVTGRKATEHLDYLTAHPGYTLHRVTTTSEMRDKVMELLPDMDLYISAAAPCDIEFAVRNSKLKKEKLGDTLPILRTPDILLEVLQKRRAEQFVVGFAAESGVGQEIFIDKWHKKPVDLLIGNFVRHGLETDGQPQGFSCEDNRYYIVAKGEIQDVRTMTKADLAREIYRRTIGLKEEN